MTHSAHNTHDTPTAHDRLPAPHPVLTKRRLGAQPSASVHDRLAIHAIGLLLLAILATWATEHSALDVAISQLFYQHGAWLITKGSEPYALVFYDLPKAALILFGVYLLGLLVLRYAQQRYMPAHAVCAVRGSYINPPPAPFFATRDIGYLLASIITVPSVIGLLKAATHVSCPNQLSVFGGAAPYLSLWQDIAMHSDAKCFPAAHASAGFGLLALAYLPRLRDYRAWILSAVLLLGWVMGVYKMMIGDHFFSHTLVSMLLSWALVCALAWVFYRRAPLAGNRC
ncbi:PAP2 family lipid A phosphatase [Psychrobacter aestuarii]|uniref:Phosphatidic acid phosphatase type 2/haloperoxidase domain-containing protein n=1 Tax=Psychrobacter aestuarii TaxID=556327 RepID=A0ABP3FI43_9GAMM|nr:PAP2 family lipid A phosphatase [Psychrobacter aestuarii]